MSHATITAVKLARFPKSEHSFGEAIAFAIENSISIDSESELALFPGTVSDADLEKRGFTIVSAGPDNL